MKTIHKFVLKSYLGPMILTFFIVMFVLLMNFLWRYIDELVGKGIDMGTIVELLCYAMANMISLGLPLATLLAAIMTMGNLGENYELLAMKSAGMSLPQILKPLIVLTGIIAVGSFFVVNNLVPYSNRKMQSLIFDIKQMKQTIEFQDGLFFNGIDDMSIRVGHQDPQTGLLTDVLIYSNPKNKGGDMTTTLADSGYIRLSDDKRFLEVILFEGERYDQTRNANAWYNKSALDRYVFSLQQANLPMKGFDMQRTDASLFNNSQTQNIRELQQQIDTLERQVSSATTRSYDPLLKERIFARDTTVVVASDSLSEVRRGFPALKALDSLEALDLRTRSRIWNQAVTAARNSRSMFSFDESQAKDALNQLYRSKVEWHRKISLPVSIMIFFLIGAPLGAIIRKGGLGMPIVISVIFFVIYYIISLSGEKMAKEGTWEALYGMWLSPFILAPIAVYLTYKATNDSSLLDMDWYRAKLKPLADRLEALVGRAVRIVRKERDKK
ncbi:MAG: LptF/LptG family permease [Alistipes sp.]|nr:LptF/LptG family permease [Alistipes sp.]